MSPEFLTTSEFQRWAEAFDKKLDEIAALRTEMNKHAVSLGVLKDRADRAKGVNGAISAVISGITSALVTFFGGGVK